MSAYAIRNERNRDQCFLCCGPVLPNEPVSSSQSDFLSEKYQINVSLIDILFYIHEFYKVRFFSWSLAIKYATIVKILWQNIWDELHGGIWWWGAIKRRQHWKRYLADKIYWLTKTAVEQWSSIVLCSWLMKFNVSHRFL